MNVWIGDGDDDDDDDDDNDAKTFIPTRGTGKQAVPETGNATEQTAAENTHKKTADNSERLVDSFRGESRNDRDR